MEKKEFELSILYKTNMKSSDPSPNVTCLHCTKDFYRVPAEIKRSIKHFCSNDCAQSYRKASKHLYYTDVECLECSEIFSKRNIDIAKTPKNFCSRTCAAKYNNKVKPKRKVEGSCKSCNSPIASSLSYCKSCSPHIPVVKGKFYYDDKTLEEATRNGKKASRYCQIREYARKVLAKSGRPKSCANCGYDKHVETCHIKSISSFDSTTTIGEINDLSNLIYLCPNCHWELDKGILKVSAP